MTAGRYITGGWLGDVVVGLVLVLLLTFLGGVGLFMPPRLAIPWILLVALGFIHAHGRRQRPASPGRAAVAIRLRPPAVPFTRIAAAAAATLVLGAGVGGLLQIFGEPIRSPIAPTESNFLEELVTRPGGWLTLTVYAVVLAPVVEEFCLRGWAQRALERRWGALPGILLAALLFAALHGWYGRLELLAIPLTLGVVCGGAVYLARSIWAGVLLHAAWNGTLMVIVKLMPHPADAAGSEAAPQLLASLAMIGVGVVWLGWLTGQVRRGGARPGGRVG
jgi:membrane protease YdiL (CAAX protease family)